MNMPWYRKKSEFLFFIFLALVCVALSYQINFPSRDYVRKFEISSDKADYYIYLPATFIYGWDVNKFQKNVDIERQGFTLDYKTGKVLDKTTCGVAILWLPFFLVAHSIALIFNLQPDGFSPFYEHFSVIPGPIFLVLGLFFLRRFLKRYFTPFISYLTVILLFLGTNLYYYSIDEGLMSHVNSFFLFCLYLFLLTKFLDREKKSTVLFIGISFVVSLAILIRPTNIIILSWMAFIDAKSWKDVKDRFLLFLRPKYVLIFIAAFVITFLPQLIYWKYLTGSFLYYSYPGEGFTNWKNPRLISFWFSPLNGLFLYSPLVLTFVAGSIWMIIRKVPNGIFTFFFFFLVSYIFSSWYCWFFGGSFGCRPFIEYFALLSVPFGYFLSKLSELKNLFIRSLLILFIIACCWFNLKTTYNSQWVTFSTWSWDDYLENLEMAGLAKDPGRTYTYINDFENSDAAPVGQTNIRYHSATMGGSLDAQVLETAVFSRNLGQILKNPVKRITLSLWVNQRYGIKTGAIYQCYITDEKNEVIFKKEFEIDPVIHRADYWYELRQTIRIPEWINQYSIITFKVINPQKSELYIDDQKLIFE